MTVFVVDLSGWTDTWTGWLRRWLRKELDGSDIKDLRPFTCSLCMTWWLGLAWLLVRGQLAIPNVAYVAGISFLTKPAAELATAFRYLLEAIICKLNINIDKIIEHEHETD